MKYSREIAVGILVVLIITSLVVKLKGDYSPPTATSPSSSKSESSTSQITSTNFSSALEDTKSATNPSGLQLTLSINATQLTVGQSLELNISLFNTLPVVNTIPTAMEWPFGGVSFAVWGDCFGTATPSKNIFAAPVYADVVKGDYTLDNISSITNSFHATLSCEEGNGVIDHVVFQPSSSIANLTGLVNGLAPPPTNETLGPIRLANYYVTDGSWNASSIMGYIAYVRYTPSIEPPVATPFVPGVYTVAVCDEWGQAVILHFQVT